MLKNLRVRTKLIAVLAVPLAALIVMAGIGVLDRRDQAADARDGRYLAELTAARVELVHQLQAERTWAGATLAGGTTTTPESVTTQRAATDAAVQKFIEDADSARSVSGALDDQITKVVTDVGQLGSIRQSIDAANINSQVGVAYYTRVIVGLSDLADITASASRGTDLQGDLASLAALSSVKELQASVNAEVAQILGEGVGHANQFTTIDDTQKKLDLEQERFFNLASDAARRKQLELDAASDSQSSAILQQQVESIGPDRQIVSVSNDQWIPASGARLDTLRAVEDFITNDVHVEATRVEDEATRAERNFLFGAAGVVLLSLLLASVVARSIARPLSRLTQGAYRLSEEGLPALVEQLRNPEAEGIGEELAPIPIDSKDEIGQLASAFNSIQDVTKSVATEQATMLRKGIGDIFVNLARRNQTLLDRQIEFIDQLESREEDPDQLENLFKLDHLATRMRRNAESLLVLAGAEPPRRRGRPVDMADVVRVAIGEVEHFSRITLLALDEATVSATVAVDLAHLLSELMENATQFSPPDSHVEIVGHKTRDGNYVLSVSDQGIGMSAEQLADANKLMANPPVVGLALSRSLGFIVIGRLAARFGVVVRLTASPSGGVSALVSLPNTVIDVQAPPENLTSAPVTAPDDASSITESLASTGLFAPVAPQPQPEPEPAILEAPAEVASPEAEPEPELEVEPEAEPEVPSPTALGLTPIVEEPEAPPAVVDLVTEAPAGPSVNGHGPADHGLPPLPSRQPGETMPPAARDLPPAAREAAPPPPPPPPPIPVAEEIAPAAAPVAPPPPPPVPVAEAPAPPAPPVVPQPRYEPAPVEAPEPSIPSAPVAGTPLPTRRLAPSAPDSPGGVDTGVTAGGLTRRVPKATTPSPSLSSSSPVAAPQRSPEEVRLMLSRYRSGLRRGRTDDDNGTEN